MPLILPGNVASATASTGYEVANSCRFNDDDSAYIHKTATSGNQRTWTFSCWFKFADTGTQYFLSQSSATNSYLAIYNQSSEIRVYEEASNSQTLYFRTNRLLRDFSSWYHLCVAVDTTQATDTNRIKIYINGVQETSFASSSYPSQNTDTNINHGSTVLQIGRYDKLGGGTPTHYLNSYIAEAVLIDGSALTPTSFGEFDEDSPTIWKPIDVSGLTFGNNGFYLDFEDSSNLGNDANGGTDLTEVNLAATDQSLDTPTVNYPVMNPLDAYWPTTGTSWAFSEGNLQVVAGTGSNSSTGYSYNNATFALSAGKFYWEVKPTNVGGSSHIGIISEGQVYNKNLYEITNSDAYTWNIRNSSGSIHNNNSISSYASSYTTNDIIGVALDLDNNKLYFSKNGDWGDGSGSWDSSTFDAAVGAITITAAASNGSGHYFPTVGASDYSTSSTFQLNFGSAPYTISSGNADGNDYGNFEYAVPSGFLAINSYNLGTAGG
jgi:hypothetical protein